MHLLTRDSNLHDAISSIRSLREVDRAELRAMLTPVIIVPIEISCS
jgi:hypothetical protein